MIEKNRKMENFIPLTQEQKSELGIVEGNEVFVFKAESLDFCGVWECFAIQAADEEAAEELLTTNYEDILYSSIRDYYDEEDVEELGDISYSVHIEDASGWEAEWLSNSTTCINFNAP